MTQLRNSHRLDYELTPNTEINEEKKKGRKQLHVYATWLAAVCCGIPCAIDRLILEKPSLRMCIYACECVSTR